MSTDYAKTPGLIPIIKREFKRISEKKTLYLLAIFLPLVLAGLLSYIYVEKTVRDIPIGVCDLDNSETSRLILRSLDATSSIKLIDNFVSKESARQATVRGKNEGFVFIPTGFERDLKKGKSSHVYFFKNAANLIIGNLLLRDASATIRTISTGAFIKKIRSRGAGYQTALSTANPIRIETQSLFNPNYNYVIYLIPGLISFIVQMVIMVSAVLLISSEYVHDTFTELVRMAQGKVWLIIAGKSIPHLLIHTATILGIFGIVFPLIGVSVKGDLITAILFFILFAAASFFMGLFLSAVIKNQMTATEAAIFINTPAFIFSGLTFPLEGMPALHNLFAQIIPLTHFLKGFIKIYMMGAPVKFIYGEVLILSGFLLVSALLTGLALKLKLKNYETESV